MSRGPGVFSTLRATLTVLALFAMLFVLFGYLPADSPAPDAHAAQCRAYLTTLAWRVGARLNEPGNGHKSVGELAGDLRMAGYAPEAFPELEAIAERTRNGPLPRVGGVLALCALIVVLGILKQPLTGRRLSFCLLFGAVLLAGGILLRSYRAQAALLGPEKLPDISDQFVLETDAVPMTEQGRILARCRRPVNGRIHALLGDLRVTSFKATD